jgi:hypothetical protein
MVLLYSFGARTKAGGGGDGIRTRDDKEPRHYPRPILGLKSASLLGPSWLFRCIRKDPLDDLLLCPDVTPADFKLFTVPAPIPGGRPRKVIAVKSRGDEIENRRLSSVIAM